jgi:hypothetical protein
MIRAQKLPEILDGVLHDGVRGVVLMTVDGSVISSKFLDTETFLTETSLAAITSSTWSNYSQSEDCRL